MTVRGRRRCPALLVLLGLLTGCSTTVSGAPTPQAMPAPVATTSSMPPAISTTTAAAPTTTPEPKPTTHAPAPPKPTAPPVHQKMVTYSITGSGTVSVRYLAGGTMHSANNIGLPWRKTVPLSGGEYAMDITTGSDANVDEQVSVAGVVVGTGHNQGAGSGSFGGSY
jgi:hypothetical protein